MSTASGAASGVTVDLIDAPLAALVRVTYGEILKKPFVLDDRLAQTKVTFQWREAKPDQIKRAVDTYLSRSGIQVEDRAGVTFFSPGLVALPMSGTPTDASASTGTPERRADGEPSNLEPLTISEVIEAPAIDGLDKALALLKVQVAQAGGKYILTGDPAQVAMAKTVIGQLATGGRVLDVRVVVTEFSGSRDDGNGFQAALAALGGKLNLVVGRPVSGAAVVSFRNHSLDVVAGIVSTAADFRLVQDARLRVRTGRKGRLTVGDKVPTLGSAALDNQSRAVQSIVYQEAGLSVEVQPFLQGETVQSDVTVTLSQFLSNSTSGIDSPVKQERAVVSQIEANLGEVVCIGGLQSQKDTDASFGFLGWTVGNQRSSNQSTVLVFLSFDTPAQPG